MKGWVRFGWCGLALVAGACATLPDTSGYTAATVEVRQAAASAGAAVGTEIDAAAETLGDPDARRSVRDSGQAFAKAWAVTLGSLDAAVSYASSIEEITRAGNHGGESARAVAGSVATLAGMLGVAIGPAAGAITETGAFVYGEIAKIRAARSLEAALAAADPAIVRLQEVVHQQVANARVTCLRALAAQRRALDRDTNLGFYPLHDAELEAEQKARLAELADAVLHPAERGARVASLKGRLAVIHDTRAALADGLARYDERSAALARRRGAALALFDATDTAIAAWTSAHARLAAAVRERQPVTPASLTAAAEDLRLLVQKWRDL